MVGVNIFFNFYIYILNLCLCVCVKSRHQNLGLGKAFMPLIIIGLSLVTFRPDSFACGITMDQSTTLQLLQQPLLHNNDSINGDSG